MLNTSKFNEKLTIYHKNDFSYISKNGPINRNFNRASLMEILMVAAKREREYFLRIFYYEYNLLLRMLFQKNSLLNNW